MKTIISKNNNDLYRTNLKASADFLRHEQSHNLLETKQSSNKDIVAKQKTKKITAFIGLMGVGKTTIGKKLAEKTGSYFIDCDQEIEDREAMTINEIFAKKGEKYFRQIEQEIIHEIILRDEKMVLSLGGGAFMNEETRKILKDKAITIWLEAPIEVILKRVAIKNNRPLLAKKNKRQILEELIKKRYPAYEEADFRFNSDSETNDALVKKIIKKLDKK